MKDADIAAAIKVALNKEIFLPDAEKRAKCLMAYYEGDGISIIAKKAGCSVRSIRRWIKAYHDDGISGIHFNRSLKSVPLKPAQISEIKSDLLHNPIELGLPYSVWNDFLVNTHILNKYGISYSNSFCESILAETDTSYKSKNYSCYKSENLKNEFEEAVKKALHNNTNVWVVFPAYIGEHKQETFLLKMMSIELVRKWDELSQHKKISPFSNIKKYQRLSGPTTTIGYMILDDEGDILEDVKIGNKMRDTMSLTRILHELITKCKRTGKDKCLIVLPSSNVYKKGVQTLLDRLDYQEYNYQIMYIPKGYLGHSNATELFTILDANGNVSFSQTYHYLRDNASKLRKHEARTIKDARIAFSKSIKDDACKEK